ncbi:MAG TPA: four-carbon acid sugar kinase family protein [Bryocella sp.]|nr:four-carbon acid sugar kinase family protein [Bryocella sp.]
MAGLLYTFYGDDFTGSTDVLEQLALGGVRGALFLTAPTSEDLERLPGLQAIGVAGDSRSQTPEWMSTELPPIFTALRRLGAPVLHYKVCSTFDSSPRRGSIGRALEIGLEVFGCRYAPIVVGAPYLQRFVMEGRLFALDADGVVRRIDRHTMSRHPATPMREERLVRHLAEQTDLPIGEVPQTHDAQQLAAIVETRMTAGCRAVLFDTVDVQDLEQCGHVIWTEAERQNLFGVGSSGFTAALISAWQSKGLVKLPAERAARGRITKAAGPLLVISGSCSAATERQVRWALAHGFYGVKIDAEKLMEASESQNTSLVERVSGALDQQQNVVAYTALGTPAKAAHGDELGEALGVVLKQILERTGIRRVLVCGGDTSSQAVRQLGLRALTWKRNLQRGVPLCRAYADGSLDGLEIALKGGQMGTADFFAIVRDAEG